MATIKTPLQRLTEIETQIRIAENEIPPLIQKRSLWQQELPNNCNFTSKNKRDACNDDRVYKMGKIQAITQQITSLRDSITRLNEERETIEAAQAAQDTATVNLSEQGHNFEAMVIEAHGASQANQIKSELEGQAILQQAAASSEVVKDESETKKNLLIGGGVVLAIIAITVTVIIVKSRTA